MRTKVIIRVGRNEADAFEEEYFVGESSWFPAGVDVKVSAQRLVDWFNEGQKARSLPLRQLFDVRVELVDEPAGPRAHEWSKTNLVTVADHRGVFDTVKCSRCGVTARRYGISHIVRQSPYRAKKFAVCLK